MREKKTEGELLKLIKEALRGNPECASVHIRLTKGDLGIGNNWTVAVAQDGVRVSPCYRRIVEVSRGLARKYDLAD